MVDIKEAEMERKDLKRTYLICCILGFVPKLITILTTSYPLGLQDEFWLFAIPAKLAGLDWTSSMYAYRYYGYGFSILFTPLFKYMDDSVLLYRIILITVAAVQLIIPVISCYLLHNFFGLKKISYNVLISMICLYSISIHNMDMYNDHIYFVWIWIAFWILAKLWIYDDKKKKFIYSILLGGSFVGALTVHQRALTLILAFIILYIFIRIVIKKKICYILPVVAIYISGNIVHKKLMAYFIKLVKANGSNEIVDISNTYNTQVEIKFSLMWLQDKEYLQAAAKTIMGNLNVWNVYTIGIGVFSVILGIYFLILLWKNKVLEEEQKRLLYFGLFGVSMVFITIVGLATTWGWGIKNAYKNSNAGNDSLRGLVYLRYFIVYYPPVMLGALAYIYKHVDVYIKLFRYTFALSGFLLVYYLAEIVPLMKNRDNGFGALKYFSPHLYGLELTSQDYLIAAGLFLLLLKILKIFIRHKKIVLAVGLICAMTGWREIHYVYFETGQMHKMNYQYVDSSSKIVEGIETEKINIPIYVYEKRIKGTIIEYLYEMQFVNINTEFHRGKPEIGLAEAVYITPYPDEAEDLLENGYECVKIDNEEYMYMKGDKICRFVQKYLER